MNFQEAISGTTISECSSGLALSVLFIFKDAENEDRRNTQGAFLWDDADHPNHSKSIKIFT